MAKQFQNASGKRWCHKRVLIRNKYELYNTCIKFRYLASQEKILKKKRVTSFVLRRKDS